MRVMDGEPEPGRAAYEAAVATGETTTVTWDELPHMRRRAWVNIERAAVAKYENAITWGTSCLSCSAVLDSCIRETNRADELRSLIAEILDTLARGNAIDIDEYRERAGITADAAGQPAVCPKCGTAGCLEDANSGWYDTGQDGTP